MSKLDITLVGFSNVNGLVSVDGKFVKFKKVKSGTYAGSVNVKNDNAELILYRSHHYAGKAWFFWNLLYFFISLFGIFDIRQDKKCLVQDVRLNVNTVNDSGVALIRKKIIGQGRLVDIQTNTTVDELSNLQFYDAQAIKRRFKMRLFKALFIVFAVLITAFIVVVFA